MREISRATLTLALSETRGIGGKTVARILTRNDVFGRSPSEFMRYGAEALHEEYRLPPKIAERWATECKKSVRAAEEMQARYDELGVRILTQADAGYPRRLEEFHRDSPAAIYLYGNIALLEAPTFAVVCSRDAPEWCLPEVESRVEQGVLAGEVLVGGHDTPAYQRASVVPLRWGAPRIVVLDTGFEDALGADLENEPFAGARLWRHRFDKRVDLAVSSVGVARKFHPSANRNRDIVLGGLAARLEVLWAAPGRNMEKLALSALNCGRPVAVHADSPTSKSLRSAGAKQLEK